jgi:hypothetical protein
MMSAEEAEMRGIGAARGIVIFLLLTAPVGILIAIGLFFAI